VHIGVEGITNRPRFVNLRKTRCIGRKGKVCRVGKGIGGEGEPYWKGLEVLSRLYLKGGSGRTQRGKKHSAFCFRDGTIILSHPGGEKSSEESSNVKKKKNREDQNGKSGEPS